MQDEMVSADGGEASESEKDRAYWRAEFFKIRDKMARIEQEAYRRGYIEGRKAVVPPMRGV